MFCVIGSLINSEFTIKWVMSRKNVSCHIWMSHVTYEWVMSRMNESCPDQSSCNDRLVRSHMNGSCHIWMGHVTYTRVMSHINESCPVWMSHVQTSPHAIINAVCDTQKSVMSHVTGWRRPIGCLGVRQAKGFNPARPGLFCGIWPKKIRYLMGLRHP